MNDSEVARRLADALGIKGDGDRLVSGFDVRCRGGEVRVVVHHIGEQSVGFDLPVFPVPPEANDPRTYRSRDFTSYDMCDGKGPRPTAARL